MIKMSILIENAMGFLYLRKDKIGLSSRIIDAARIPSLIKDKVGFMIMTNKT